MKLMQVVYVLACCMQAFSQTIPDKRQKLYDFEDGVGSRSSPNVAKLSDMDYGCFNSSTGSKPTTVDTCRPTLNKIKLFPDYSKQQYFEPDKSPLVPFRPPFKLTVKDSSCVLCLIVDPSKGWRERDKFSWRQIRDLATNIVEDCQPPRGEGLGGVEPIGSKRIWAVEMVGVEGPSSGIPEVGRDGIGGNAFDIIDTI